MGSSFRALLYSLFFIMIRIRCAAQIEGLSDSDIYFQTVEGTVGAGNYSYYSVQHPGRLVVWLRTTQGDADLYASTKRSKPTWLLSEHEYSSSTCGIDHIDIPAYVGRPVHIGVYGHYTHEINTYLLRVFMWKHDESDTEMVNYPNTAPYDLDILEQFATEQSTFNMPSSKNSKQRRSLPRAFLELFDGFVGEVFEFIFHLIVEILA